jgi:FtsP/CotA-like multicopper oxidase with cupredoxin domain
MFGTPWSDGVGGVSQRPIRQGETFVAKWTATQYGSYWYHAHLLSQIEDGLYGPILIRPAKSNPKPFNLITNDTKTIVAMEQAERDTKPLVLADWRHTTSTETWDITVKAGFELPCFDSILVNGKGHVQCRSPAEISALITTTQTEFLQAFGGNMTDKRYKNLAMNIR